MDDAMKKLMELKKGKQLMPIEKNAKMSVLHQMKKDMEDMMGDKLKGVKKVTVASNSGEGLAEGLDKAKHLLGEHGDADEEQMEPAEEDLGEDLDHDHEEGEPESHLEKMSEHGFGGDASEENAEHDGEESDEDLDAKIEALMKKKNSRKG